MASSLLDPYQKPPEQLRLFYKHHQKLSQAALKKDPNVIEFSKEISKDTIRVVRRINTPSLRTLSFGEDLIPANYVSSCVPVYEHKDLPGVPRPAPSTAFAINNTGLHIVPSLLSREIQWSLLSRLLHRDLANSQHKTNVHAHHKVPYDLCKTDTSKQPIIHRGLDSVNDEPSFFNCSPDCSELFHPVDSKAHKPFTISQFLSRKLRWITLGGQYDWTKKEYPPGDPPPFPNDISQLIQNAFPDMTPEAAIVNVYSPGDTLSLHRDVSEASDEGLVSISLGCDGIFIAGLDEQDGVDIRRLAVHLRSGDVVYMSGSSRYAWHGVAQILPGTCPKWLSSWPATSNNVNLGKADETEFRRHEAWRGWMETKRINLNIRQIHKSRFQIQRSEFSSRAERSSE